jgi:outer membrane protein
MKNSKILIALFSLIFLTAWSQKSLAQTIAYVEAEKVIPEMESYKKAKSEVEAYGKQLKKVLEKKQADLQKYYAEVSKAIQDGTMTPKQQQEAEAKLQKMQTELQQEAQQADRKLVEKEGELVAPVYKQFNDAVAKVAKENKYQYVLDKQMLLYSLGGIDATEKIKTALGISW